MWLHAVCCKCTERQSRRDVKSCLAEICRRISTRLPDVYPEDCNNRSYCCNNFKCHTFIYTYMRTTVAQWLRCCATNRKVADSIPAGVSRFFIDIKSSLSHYGPEVDSTSNRNEYQEHFLAVRLKTLPPSCAVVMKSGNLNVLEPSGPLQACNWTDLPIYIYIYIYIYRGPLLFMKHRFSVAWERLRSWLLDKKVLYLIGHKCVYNSVAS